MQRRALDRIISLIGLSLTVMLIVAGGLLTWAHTFVTNEVHTQLAAQQIYFPAEGNKAIAAPEFSAMHKYAGKQLTTGAQAQTYADHFIANHLKAIGGGKTFSQVSAAAQASPTDTKLAGTAETMFKGETLRGLLLNAYAFGTMGFIAGIAAIAAFVAAAVMLMLSVLGWMHGRRTPPTEAAFHSPTGRAPVTVG